jgi:hypothetical protein
MDKATRLIIAFLSLFSYPIAHAYLMVLGEYGVANTGGFNQIPRGGSQDSSSYRRPTFDELNIAYEAYHSFGVGAHYQTWQMLYKHSAIHLEKSAILNQALFSHGLALPIDTLYHFNIALNKHTIQLTKQFLSFPKNNNFHFNLIGAVDWLGYHYHFYPLQEEQGVATPSSYREFVNLSCSIGMEFRYQWTPYSSSVIFLSTSLPSFHFQVREARFVQKFYVKKRYLHQFNPYVGLSYMKIDLQDNQGLANHLRFTTKPYVFSGIEVLLF